MQNQDNHDIRFPFTDTGNIDDLMAFPTGLLVSHNEDPIDDDQFQQLMNKLANEAKDLWQYTQYSNTFPDIFPNIDF